MEAEKEKERKGKEKERHKRKKGGQRKSPEYILVIGRVNNQGRKFKLV